MRHGFVIAVFAVACAPATPVRPDASSPSPFDASADAPAEVATVDAAPPDLGDDAPPATREEDSAELVMASLRSSLACGAGFDAAVVMRNTGSATWTRAADYKLGAVDDSD